VARVRPGRRGRRAGCRGGPLSEKLDIPAGALRGYGARGQTRTGHLREVVAYLGWRTADGPRWKDLERELDTLS